MRPPISLVPILIAMAAPFAPGQERAPETRRPNVLLVYTDDQRYDSIGVVQREQGERGRFPWIKSPHLDRLAAEGVRFRNAFVVNSLCAPSRATFLTGRYGFENGIVNNHTPLAENMANIATLLKPIGFGSGYIGKWHMDGQRGKRPGFDYSASYIAHGRYVDCPFEVNGEATPTKGWVDDVSTDYAIEFLRSHRDRPFLLMVGFKAAHGPFDPPERFAGLYEGETARPSPNMDVSAIYNRNPNAPVRPAEARPTNLNYFRCLAAADDNMGRMMAALDELNLTNNTIVIYASDNGYYLGEHRLGDKRSAYEESLRIPLIVRYPQGVRGGRTDDHMVLNTDFVPTILDYAGITPPADLPGRSWRPLLEEKPADWRTAWYYAYFFERNYKIPTVTAVRTDRAKLIRYPGHDEWTELFDLANDPYELNNLWNNPAHEAMQKALEAEYDRQRDAVRFRIPEFADDPAGEPAATVRNAARNAWVLDLRFDHDDGNNLAQDASPTGLTARVVSAPVVKPADGTVFRRFSGQGVIEIPRNEAIDPSVAGWTVEATIDPKDASGTVLAQGGASFGYALVLAEGKPRFTVRSSGSERTIEGPALNGDRPVRLTARIQPDNQIELQVDDKVVARGRISAPLQPPREGLQIGADLGSQVLEPPSPRFRGRLFGVRVYSGVAP